MTLRAWRPEAVFLLAWLAAACGMPAGAAAPTPSPSPLEDEFRDQVRPWIKTYCLECHSAEEQEGEIDLERFASLSDLRRGRRVWQKVAQMIDKGEMPPKDSPQPEAASRKAVHGWVGRFLDAEARAHAGDPGRVVLRRLSNAEYTHTLRDLVGIDLQPAREFPGDGAAGEGFTNTGDAMAMSPSLLTKYFDAAKEIASHAVLLPDGFCVSPAITRRDWTDEIVAQIRLLYGRYADADGKLPMEAYLAAALEHREATEAGKPSDLVALANSRNLSPKYLSEVWRFLHEGKEGAGPVGDLRARWLAAKPGDAGSLAAEVGRWQAVAWKYNKVGHARPWKEPADPVRESQELRLKLQPAAGASEIVLHLAAGTAGDGPDGDLVVWEKPRVEAVALPPLPLRDLPKVANHLMDRRREILSRTARYLAAASEAKSGIEPEQVADLARKHGLEADALTAWLRYLGLAGKSAASIDGYLTKPLKAAGDVIRGWGDDATPNVIANRTDQEARVPGLVKPHGVSAHPSPDRIVAVAWRSPVAAKVKLSAVVADADPNCGDGVSYAIELRRGGGGRVLAAGAIDNAKAAKIVPIDGLEISPGDLVSLKVGPRTENHGCDLTEIDLTLAEIGGEGRTWTLSRDVADDIDAGNPHADRLGHANVWHFLAEPRTASSSQKTFLPPDSTLARWQVETDPGRRAKLADAIQTLLTAAPPEEADGPEAALHRQATSLSGPLLGGIVLAARADPSNVPEIQGKSRWGLDPSRFGKGPDGAAIDPLSVAAQAPSDLVIRLPAEFVEGQEFVATGTFAAGAEGTVQFQVSADPLTALDRLSAGAPMVARAGSAGRARIEASLDEFRRVFADAACYGRIVPVDEVITIILFHREDEALGRLVLDDAEKAKLDRLWEELRFVSQDILRIHGSFDQMIGFASQEGRADEFRPLQKEIAKRAEAFQAKLIAAEPAQLDALLRFAARAFRRPLTDHESADLRAAYRDLRAKELNHEDAFRLVMARILVSPEFLYRIERPGPGPAAQPVSGRELATRLSYFLWASMPDEELGRLADEGKLADPEVLTAQARRMLADERARGLATEFACQWLEVRDFDKLDEKSENHFPTFNDLRADMYEESIRFFADLFRRDGSLAELIDADHAFLNGPLAKHYGIPGVEGPEWRRVDGIKPYGRGGVLGMASTLSKQSGASRTSPILRGNWVVETLLGERLPRPPKGVPQLPEDEAATDGLTVRQLTEKHRAVAQCASCHDRIDPFGLALEGFDAIGRFRKKDLGDRPIDASATLADGTKFEGAPGLKSYLLANRKEQILRTFCRKLLGYALGRSTQLSDEPLLNEMVARLRADGDKFSAALDTILRSKPFREHRGLVEDEDQ